MSSVYVFMCVCIVGVLSFCFFFFKQKTAYEMRISDWSSDVCSSDLNLIAASFPTAPEIVDKTVRFAVNSGDIGCTRIGKATSQIAAHIIVSVARLEGGRARRNHDAEVETGIRRSEERRVGKEGVSKCISRRSTYHKKKQHK